MKRNFCDCCGDEITANNYFGGDGFEFPMGEDGVVIKTQYDASPQDWDVCKYCVIDAINKLDTRPKCTEKAD